MPKILIPYKVNFSFSELSSNDIFVLSSLILLLIIQLWYWFYYYSRVSFHRLSSASAISEDEKEPISVVICARNEEENLSQFLPFILEQKYPNFEVVVVNDCSTDDSDIVLQKMQNQYKHLKVTNIRLDSKFGHGKKLALTVGIKAATHNRLLLTDADCKPTSEYWLEHMTQHFSQEKTVILGYGGYLPQKGFLNKLIRFDTFFIGLQYLSFAMAKKPYMGVGRNLAYTKELYFANKGFASHNHIISGDDDLFVQEVATKKNTVVEFRHSAHTRSHACSTFAQWGKQKRRHITTSPLYRRGVKFRLFLEPFSRVLFWALGIFLLAINFFPLIIAGILAFRIIVVMFMVKMAMKRLDEQKIFLFSLFYDIFSPFLYVTLFLANKFMVKKKRWK